MMLPSVVIDEISAMYEFDRKTLAKVSRDKNLSDTYHHELKLVHNRNADRLLELVKEYSWDLLLNADSNTTHKIWLIVQHAIERPSLMREALQAFKGNSEVLPSDIARLEDRIAVLEGREQIYGTNFDWDDNQQLNPTPIIDDQNVDRRRSEVGLPPLVEDMVRVRKTSEMPPSNPEKKEEYEMWLKEVGWRE